MSGHETWKQKQENWKYKNLFVLVQLRKKGHVLCQRARLVEHNISPGGSVFLYVKLVLGGQDNWSLVVPLKDAHCALQLKSVGKTAANKGVVRYKWKQIEPYTTNMITSLVSIPNTRKLYSKCA